MRLVSNELALAHKWLDFVLLVDTNCLRQRVTLSLIHLKLIADSLPILFLLIANKRLRGLIQHMRVKPENVVVLLLRHAWLCQDCFGLGRRCRSHQLIR